MNPNATNMLLVCVISLLIAIYPGVYIAVGDRLPVVIRRESNDDGYTWSITFQSVFRPRSNSNGVME